MSGRSRVSPSGRTTAKAGKRAARAAFDSIVAELEKSLRPSRHACKTRRDEVRSTIGKTPDPTVTKIASSVASILRKEGVANPFWFWTGYEHHALQLALQVARSVPSRESSSCTVENSVLSETWVKTYDTWTEQPQAILEKKSAFFESVPAPDRIQLARQVRKSVWDWISRQWAHRVQGKGDIVACVPKGRNGRESLRVDFSKTLFKIELPIVYRQVRLAGKTKRMFLIGFDDRFPASTRDKFEIARMDVNGYETLKAFLADVRRFCVADLPEAARRDETYYSVAS